MRRFKVPDATLYVENRHGLGNCWITKDGQILIRFSNSWYKEYFRVVSPKNASSLSREILDDLITEALLEWLRGLIEDEEP